jgi:hypothetical protein
MRETHGMTHGSGEFGRRGDLSVAAAPAVIDALLVVRRELSRCGRCRVTSARSPGGSPLN